MVRRRVFFDGNIQVGLAVEVVVAGQQVGASGLRIGGAAGRAVFFDVDIAVGHEADLHPCPYLEREQGKEQEYRPTAWMFELAWHCARQGVKLKDG